MLLLLLHAGELRGSPREAVSQNPAASNPKLFSCLIHPVSKSPLTPKYLADNCSPKHLLWGLPPLIPRRKW